METIFKSLINETGLNISIITILLIIILGLIVGIIISVLYNIKTKSSKSFLTTLSILPSVVAMVIIMVNGNIGTGVAVAGAFSLIRFRSVPGTAREIGAIFLAMASGIMLGMGYGALAILFTVIICLFYLVLDYSSFGNQSENKRVLTITMPEDLNFSNAFDEILDKYTNKYELIFIKTTNMGSMYKIKYDIEIKDAKFERELIDDIRCVNGNLDILLIRGVAGQNEL